MGVVNHQQNDGYKHYTALTLAKYPKKDSTRTPSIYAPTSSSTSTSPTAFSNSSHNHNYSFSYNANGNGHGNGVIRSSDVKPSQRKEQEKSNKEQNKEQKYKKQPFFGCVDEAAAGDPSKSEWGWVREKKFL